MTKQSELAAFVEGFLSHLASMPGLAHGAVTREQLRAIMLRTEGELILSGGIYGITQKHLGAGVYSVSTKKRSAFGDRA